MYRQKIHSRFSFKTDRQVEIHNIEHAAAERKTNRAQTACREISQSNRLISRTLHTKNKNKTMGITI